MATRRRQVEIDRFQARGETTGTIYTVVETQIIIEQDTISDGTMRGKGSKSLALSDGTPVNYIDAESCALLTTGEVLRRID